MNYKILYGGTLKESLKSTVVLQDAQGETVAESNSLAGKFTITNAHLWWPYTMSEQPGYLYTLKVSMAVSIIGIIMEKSVKISELLLTVKGTGHLW